MQGCRHFQKTLRIHPHPVLPGANRQTSENDRQTHGHAVDPNGKRPSPIPRPPGPDACSPAKGSVQRLVAARSPAGGRGTQSDRANLPKPQWSEKQFALARSVSGTRIDHLLGCLLSAGTVKAGFDESVEQRRRLFQPRLELRMRLCGNEERMVWKLDELHQLRPV